MRNIMIYKTRTEIETLTDRLVDRSLPRSLWTHAAHFATGFCLLHRYDLDKVVNDMPNIIRAYNEATGTPNTDDEGYHHTLTLFYLYSIDEYIHSLPKEYDFVDACHLLISGEKGAKDYPFRFYSKKTLFSLEARHGWVSADLQ